MLFKILHGDASRISTNITPYHEGYCYVTHNGDFYVDMNNERVKLNAKDAETIMGASLANVLNNNSLEISTSQAVFSAIEAAKDDLNTNLNSRIDDVENDIATTNETLSGVSKELENYKTTNNNAISENATGIVNNKTEIEKIKGDYLTSVDKEELQDNISKVSEKATTNASAIEILNGDGHGSVKQSIDNAFNEFAANVTNDDVVNTYKELIDYAATHNAEFVTLVGEVDTINTHVGEVESSLSDYKTEVSEQFTEVDTTINNHVTNINNPHSVTKEQVGLANVDNTSDIEKPISNAVQEALDDKADVEHVRDVNNPHSVTKEQIGLENVDNTADLEKPISNAMQEALNEKADAGHISDNSNPHNVTKEQIGLENVDNTSDLEKPISNATQASLDEKSNVGHTHDVENIISGVLTVERGGTGYDSMIDTTYTTARYRASALVSYETTPYDNGIINWMYE